MRKKLFAVVMAASMMMVATGCGKNTEKYTGTREPDLLTSPQFTAYYPNDNTSFRYLVDERTGVVYLVYYAGQYKIGMTVMLNADGSPMTISQLLIDGNETITELEANADGY